MASPLLAFFFQVSTQSAFSASKLARFATIVFFKNIDTLLSTIHLLKLHLQKRATLTA